jgi:LIVCS family branched-chain amino acid:cation transporter
MQSTYKKTDLYATGMAIFAMFFGAGNIIFPLVLGQQLFAQIPYAILGLLVTAVVVPFSGLLAMFLYQGQMRDFFGRLGQWPGLMLAFLIITLLGPVGSTPRCITLSFSTLKLIFPDLDPFLFNAIACGCLFLMAYKKQCLLDMLGYLLTPLLLMLLALVIIKGLWNPPLYPSLTIQIESYPHFWKGLKEGYNTMDLLAAFFFAPVIIHATQAKTAHLPDPKSRLMFVLKASVIGATLLGLIYLGFSFLASLHAADLQGIPAEELLAALSLKILGPQAGFMICLIVVLACLTTAIALIAAFTSFIQQELLGGKGSYPWILAFSLLVTSLVSCFEFQGISRFLTPILEICYPFLILLTVYNLIERLYWLRGIPQTVKENMVKSEISQKT